MQTQKETEEKEVMTGPKDAFCQGCFNMYSLGEVYPLESEAFTYVCKDCYAERPERWPACGPDAGQSYYAELHDA